MLQHKVKGGAVPGVQVAVAQFDVVGRDALRRQLGHVDASRLEDAPEHPYKIGQHVNSFALVAVVGGQAPQVGLDAGGQVCFKKSPFLLQEHRRRQMLHEAAVLLGKQTTQEQVGEL